MTKYLTETKVQDPQEKTFCALVAKGFSPTSAYRRAFPAKRSLAYGTIRNHASKLMTKYDIITEVEIQREKMAKIADKGLNRLDEIIEDGDATNARQASEFIIEQVHGKAVQRTQIIGKHVVVTYDLSGGQAGEPPKEILDQLEATD